MPELEEGSFSFEDETEEETTVEGEGEDTTEGQDEGQGQQINNQDEGQDQQGQDQQQSQKTEKGTKLADDPLSQANQLRANAERKLKQAMDYIARIEAERNGGQQQQDKGEELFLDPSKIETTEDLQKFAGSLIKMVEQKQAQLDGQLKQTAQEREAEKTKSFVLTQAEQVQSKFPMFREFNADGTPNSQYDPELDKALADLYNELDFDDKSQSYRGKVSLLKLAETIMKTSKRGEATGSQKAQTQVIDKRIGAIKQGGKPAPVSPDTSKMTASGIIASRIAEGAKSRR